MLANDIRFVFAMPVVVAANMSARSTCSAQCRAADAEQVAGAVAAAELAGIRCST
jgi:hypothetical protein